MSRVFTTSRFSLKKLRDEGYHPWVVEHYNFYSGLRQDLFNIIDILAVGHGKTIAVQCTSYSNVSPRIRKIRESPYLPAILESGWEVYIHGWRKVVVKGKKAKVLKCRVVRVESAGETGGEASGAKAGDASPYASGPQSIRG